MTGNGGKSNGTRADSGSPSKTWEAEEIQDEIIPLEETGVTNDIEKQRENGGHAEDYIIIGRNDDGSATYTTRFAIDMRAQRHDAWVDTLHHEWFPCCARKGALTLCERVWYSFRSDGFLIILEAGVLILGTLKLTMHTRDTEERLHIAEHFLEIFLTMTHILICMVDSVYRYHNIRKVRQEAEDVHGHRESGGRGVRRLVKIYLLVGTTLIILCVFIAVMLLLYSAVEWSILTNIFAMSVAMTMYKLLTGRISNMIMLIRHDQYKAVIFESELILTDLVNSKDPAKKELYSQQARHFLRALGESALYSQPRHMRCTETFPPRLRVSPAYGNIV